MDALDNIFSRVSVRAYADKRISEDAIHTILQAAMSGPSCVNSRDWSFIVVQNRETLRKMAGTASRLHHCLQQMLPFSFAEI